MSGTLTSIADQVRPLAAGAEIVGIAWLGDTPCFALADGAILRAPEGAILRAPEGGELRAPEGGAVRAAAHPSGAILAAAADPKRLVTAGDDGRVVETRADGTSRVLAETGGAWVDALALHPDGGVAFAAGKRVTALDAKGRAKTYEAPSAARGLAFAPKGYRLAIAHYGGSTLWFPNLEPKPELLDWKGSHIDVTWSPDGRFVVTSMQENALHGWRLQPDRGHMRMSGYTGKPRSLSWSFGGAWLATSGADAAIVWPFGSKEGPMGKAPRECGVRHARVARVAFHPHVNVLAIGYEDGCVLLVRFDDGAELLARRPDESKNPVTALAWDKAGGRLAFGCQDGAAGILTIA